METKSLLIGIVSFIAGALLVSTAAVTFERPKDSMSAMTQTLSTKSGDEFDEAFLHEMILHHESAVDMSKQVKEKAKHDELKLMADQIITAQEKEISQMKQWIKDWGYSSDYESHSH